MLWIIGCSVFCGCSYMKERNSSRRRSEEVSHVLCQFVDHSFDCCRLDREIVVINKNLFCRAQEKDAVAYADAETPSKCNMLILLLLLSVM